MHNDQIKVCIAAPGDAEELLAIYAPYVENTAISFETEVPTVRTFGQRIEKTLKKYPYLKAVRGGEILGYAYTGAFIDRRAYDWSVETTIYLKQSERGQGIGKILYEVLEKVSRAQHFLTMYACIGIPEEQEDEYLTFNSQQFHRHLGFETLGTFPRCGYKFGRWYGMTWMGKEIAEYPEEPKGIIPFPLLTDEILTKCGIWLPARFN